MSGKFDVYSLCGCGSGKKLKFCCAEIVEEIVKAGRLQEQGQHNMAIQALDRIEQKHPGYPWTAIVKVSVLLETGKPADAYHLIEETLKQHPKHTLAVALRADSAFNAWGFDVSKPALYQTFYLGVENYPHLPCNLAKNVALELLGDRRYLAARQYLGLAMRLTPPEGQQQAYMAMMEFDGDEKIPYPMRSVHHLDELEGSEENAEIVERADHFSSIGQWQAAALEYEKLSEVDSENSAVWKNLGFCYAWDGEEEKAAIALHKSATFIKDFDEAVEIETVAQLLDLYNSDDNVKFMELEYRGENVTEMVSVLDFHPRFERDGDVSSGMPEYTILDRPSTGAIEDADFPLSELPLEIGGVVIDITREEPDLLLTGLDSDNFVQSKILLEEAASDEEVNIVPDAEPQQKMTLQKSRYQLMSRKVVSPKSHPAIKAKLRRQIVQNKLESEWCNEPNSALDDKSPNDVADESDYKVRLTAALYVLDSISEIILGAIDLDKMLKQFDLPSPTQLKFDNDQPLHLLSNMQIHRLDLADLKDEQLRRVLDRARLTNHSPFVYALLTEAISRPEFAQEHMDMFQVYSTLSSICQEKNQVEEALKWIDLGKSAVKSEDEGSFESKLQWDIRKLSLLIYEQDDSQFKEHLQYVKDQYGHKVPQYLQSIEETLIDILHAPLPVSLTPEKEPASETM